VDWRADRIGSALRGENPMVMARTRSGFAVIGDTQHLPGYSLLLTDDPAVDHLTDLDWERRAMFLFDLALLGEAVERACRPHGLRRLNYEVLGNSDPTPSRTHPPSLQLGTARKNRRPSMALLEGGTERS
jgi:diadenosine tetraphosphate (Ap4A) HIT family hydrolase